MDASDFPCTSCGLCCVGTYEYAKKHLTEWGFLGEDNRCIHLTESARDDGKPIYLCSIYGDRPKECRIDQSALIMDLQLTQEEVFKISSIGCNTLQEREGFDESYRVRLSTHGAE